MELPLRTLPAAVEGERRLHVRGGRQQPEGGMPARPGRPREEGRDRSPAPVPLRPRRHGERARQRPPTRRSAAHSRVSNTPGLTHQAVISFDASAWNTRSGVAASSTDARSCPFARSADTRAPPWLLLLMRSPPSEGKDRPLAEFIGDRFLTREVTSSGARPQRPSACLRRFDHRYPTQPMPTKTRIGVTATAMTTNINSSGDVARS